MSNAKMTPELLSLIADRFKVLAEPARLEILQALRAGERSVSDLAQDTGLGQANLSKHLRSLYDGGFVERHREGLFVIYRLADKDVFRICDLMCGRLEELSSKRRKLLASR
ncbi:MAG: winged helix-turn-helix transcriptional regulator [Gemmatimonadota bacterium]|nr:winged helix-turn-helix transcriptional regulator [Gemmatimonadota bacterium]HEU4990333.1 metalloregulator ArsR/SmtB family transcription factor [Gemmatimonadaceae bacterium]